MGYKSKAKQLKRQQSSGTKQKLLGGSYPSELRCLRQTIEVVGLPEASNFHISGKLQKYWATLDPIPSTRLHQLINVIKDHGGGLLVNLIDAHTVVSPSDLITKIIPKIPNLPAIATAEIREILASYDPQTEVVVLSCLPPELSQSIATLLHGHTVLYIIIYKYCFENSCN